MNHRALARRVATHPRALAGATLLCIAMACGDEARTRGRVAADGRQSNGDRVTDSARVLRVCADPNNMPFSNEARAGFENAIVELLARELGARVEYTWWAQRRGFVRNTLRAGSCDVIPGVPASMEMTLATRPYYRSSYMFVTRRDANIRFASLDDDQLRQLRVGVQLIGDDYANSPPAHALARRGIVQNVRGYSVYGDYNNPDPPRRIVDAVANRDVDVAIAWGPMAAYFAAQSNVPLTLQAVTPEIDIPFSPMVFDMAMGVRREDISLRDELQRVMDKRRVSIDSILDAFHVPRTAAPGAAVGTTRPNPSNPSNPSRTPGPGLQQHPARTASLPGR
jgi:mxaJ protein